MPNINKDHFSFRKRMMIKLPNYIIPIHVGENRKEIIIRILAKMKTIIV